MCARRASLPRRRASASSSTAIAGPRRARAEPMRPDVSVIMPAYRAADTIVRAAQSVFAQAGVAVELVLCADDEVDYGAIVRPELPATAMLTLCRTSAAKSGPSAARNIAL